MTPPNYYVTFDQVSEQVQANIIFLQYMVITVERLEDLLSDLLVFNKMCASFNLSVVSKANYVHLHHVASASTVIRS